MCHILTSVWRETKDTQYFRFEAQAWVELHDIKDDFNIDFD